MPSRAAVLPLVAAGVGAAAVAHRLRLDIAAARERLAEYAPRVAQTALGPVEYAERGAGPAVLEIHGAMGGFDQGLFAAAGAFGEDARVIAPSRFGYLGSPLPPGATPAGQADALAALLDTLGLERVPVVAHSAGTTSALWLALRHPDRVTALVLVSPNAPGLAIKLPPQPVMRAMFGSDLAFWLLGRYRRVRPDSQMGVPAGYALTRDDVASVVALMDTMLPASERRDGALFDVYVSNPEIETIALQDVAVPTLVVGARDDPLTLHEKVAAMARRIPGARLVSLERGGHQLLGGDEVVRREVREFLARAGA